jgi:hypothetical protein
VGRATLGSSSLGSTGGQEKDGWKLRAVVLSFAGLKVKILEYKHIRVPGWLKQECKVRGAA